MSRAGTIARRTFLFGAVAITGGVAFGVWQIRKDPPNPLKTAAGETALSPFVLIDAEGVTLIAPRAEMGQGVQTTWAALLAEELDIAWEDVRVLHGPPAKAYYNSAMVAEGLPGKGYDTSEFQHSLGESLGGIGKLMDLQVTGGSTSMRDGFERMRVAGATAREMLKAAAAQRLGLDVTQLGTENGAVVSPDGTRLPYPDLAEDAARLSPPDIELRPQSEWRYLGRTMPRLDMVSKSTGTATFGIDVRQPDMRFASLRMNPAQGGAMLNFDATAAQAMPGVEKIVDLDTGVAVIATNTWTAIRAVNSIDVHWGPALYPDSTEAIFGTIAAAFDADANSTMRDDGDADSLPDAATTIEAEYRVPFLAHAAMEPMNATARISADGLELWCGNQSPLFVQTHCADAAGIDAERVTVHTPFMGGGFGRRGEVDVAVLATRIAMALPGTAVQTVWSREEDMRHDFYRPGAIARMRGAVANGTAVMLDAQVAAPNVTAQALTRWSGFAPPGPDKTTVDGLFNQPYGIPNYRVRGHIADLAVPVGFWRSVGASHNGFFHESFIDELAHAAGADPLAFRLSLVRDVHAPSAGVLEAVRDMSGWTGDTPEGVGRGVALCHSFGTPVAQVIELRQTDAGIRIADAWIACDVGTALDPGNIEAQMTGGMIYGLSAALHGEITFKNGAVQQGNFPDYDSLRMSGSPKVAVKVLETNRFLGGVGEPGTPPAAPALANALFDLTGIRARELPLKHQFSFVT